MRKTAIAGCAIIAIFSLLLVQGASFAAQQKGKSGKKAMIERGQYLVTAAGCNDCHTPKRMTPNGPVPDGARLLSGQPADEKLAEVPPNIFGPDKWGAITNNHLTGWAGPWGTSYAPNLSPDPETGIGAWNEELLIRILRTGKFMASGVTFCLPCPAMIMPHVRTRTSRRSLPISRASIRSRIRFPLPFLPRPRNSNKKYE